MCQQFEQLMYRIYSRISRKIYDKIMPQKLGGDLSAGHEIETFFQVPKYAISNVWGTNNQYLQLFIVCHVSYGRTGHWTVVLSEQ